MDEESINFIRIAYDGTKGETACDPCYSLPGKGAFNETSEKSPEADISQVSSKINK